MATYRIDPTGTYSKSGQAGVTVLETMVSLSIAVVLAVIGVPGLVDTIRDARRDTHVGDIVVSLNYARSEAIKRATWVTVCPSQDGEICSGISQWEDGWIVFVDANGNGVVDAADQTLRRRERLHGGTSLHGARKRVTYRSDGFSRGYTDTLRICDERGTDHARSIIVSNTGRVRVKHKSAACP